MVRMLPIIVCVVALMAAPMVAAPAGSPTSGVLATAQLAEASCTPVELQPGYPGYRGFATGLYGPGEAACLEELHRLYPWFDRAHEDAENVAAGYRLGLAGGRSSWVWENWLAIEAERGLAPTCYLTAYVEMQATPFQRAAVPATDARLRVGNIAGQELIGRAAAAAGVSPGPLLRLFPTDYQLRAHGWVASGKRHANALELEAGIADAVQELYTPDSGYWMLSPLIPVQGGYAPVPENACPDDQVFLATTTMAADAVAYPSVFISARIGQLEAHAAAWRAKVAKGSENSLRKYLAHRMDFG